MGHRAKFGADRSYCCRDMAHFRFFKMAVVRQNSVPKIFTASPIDVVVLKFLKICPTEKRRNRALFTGQKKQNFGCLSSCRYCADRAQNLPRPASNNLLTVFQISYKSVHCRECRRSYSRTREHRFLPPKVNSLFA